MSAPKPTVANKVESVGFLAGRDESLAAIRQHTVDQRNESFDRRRWQGCEERRLGGLLAAPRSRRERNGSSAEPRDDFGVAGVGEGIDYLYGTDAKPGLG